MKYSAKGFIDLIYELCIRVAHFGWPDFLIGMSCIVFLLVLRWIKDLPIAENRKGAAVIKKSLWYLSISRNALAILITSYVAYILVNGEYHIPFELSGKIEEGIPEFRLPPFTIETENRTLGFLEICGEIGSGIIVVPLVAVLANVAIAKAFC